MKIMGRKENNGKDKYENNGAGKHKRRKKIIQLRWRRTNSIIKYQVSELTASDYKNCGNAFLINFQKKFCPQLTFGLSILNFWHVCLGVYFWKQSDVRVSEKIPKIGFSC